MSTELERGAVDLLAEQWRAGWEGAGFEPCCTPDVTYEDPVAVDLLRQIVVLRQSAPFVFDAPVAIVASGAIAGPPGLPQFGPGRRLAGQRSRPGQTRAHGACHGGCEEIATFHRCSLAPAGAGPEF